MTIKEVNYQLPYEFLWPTNLYSMTNRRSKAQSL